MKSKNRYLVLTLQNQQSVSGVTLDPVACQEEPDCDLRCVRKGTRVCEAHQSRTLQAS